MLEISRRENNKIFWQLASMLFLLGFGPGFWLPALTNILKAQGWSGDSITAVFLIFPITSMLSPLVSGALADLKYSAEKLAGWLCASGTVTMVAAFYFLSQHDAKWLFIILFFITSILSAPLWSLLTAITMTHLPEPVRQFPLVRLWATIGWIAAGWISSYFLNADASIVAGYAGAATRVVLCVAIFSQRNTPPRGVPRSWQSLMGLDSFIYLKEKNLRTYLVGAGIISIPITSFFMHTPAHLKDLGVAMPTAMMSFGQWSEIVAMIGTSWLMSKCRVKTLFLLGLGFCVLRFGLFTAAGFGLGKVPMMCGILTHGLSYTFYFIIGQMYIDSCVIAAMRGQVQGLFSLITNGIGTLLGTLGIGVLYHYYVEKQHAWGSYWLILMVSALLCLLWFWWKFDDEEKSTH